MPPLILTTKLYRPPVRQQCILRPRLLDLMNRGLDRGLTLVCAPAGFGKTTLVSAWAAHCTQPIAWLTLDAGDSDPHVFLAYLAAALRSVNPTLGESALPFLQSQQPPPPEAILSVLLNDIAAAAQAFTLVLDDYHAVESPAVDGVLQFLVKNLPRSLHLIIASREDPPLPLARLRAGGRLAEVRVDDLRFTHEEAAAFLNQAMGLALAEPELATLESRTEGWIAGLHLAALSLQGRQETAAHIQAFSGSHRFVLDYLVEEVLQRQPPDIQSFLLRTSILDRLCGPLCEAVMQGESDPPQLPPGQGQAILHSLERANLFLIPLDAEQRWYRYHTLFRDLLRQQLQQVANARTDATHPAGATSSIAAYHQRASRWFAENGLDVEAFQHAVLAGDDVQAARLALGQEMPLHFRGAVTPVLNWLASLPPATLQANPALGVIYASALLYAGKVAGIDEILRAAEQSLPAAEESAHTSDLLGHIAAIRATLAVSQHRAEEIITQSRRALAYLPPDNLPVRASMTWALAYASQLQGDRVAAGKGYAEALASAQALGHLIVALLATLGIGSLQEEDNQLHEAAAIYERFLQLAGNPTPPLACQAYLGLCRISYEHDDLPAAQEHLRRAAHLAEQLEVTDRTVACLVLEARLKLAAGETSAAAVLAAEAQRLMHRHSFTQRAGDVASVQALILLRQGDIAAAEALAGIHSLPSLLARVQLARGEAAAALALLEPLRHEAETRGWADEKLRTMALQAIAFQAAGDEDGATRLLRDVLIAAAPGGFIRLFVDEGAPMAQLLHAAARRGIMPEACASLLVAFAAAGVPGQPPTAPTGATVSAPGSAQSMDGEDPVVEPLSKREQEILHLIAQGLSNREIGERLFLALDTVKGHNRTIFAKLHVQRRTEAIAKARRLGLLPRHL